MERYFHVVLKTDLNISFSTTQSVVIAKKLECQVISPHLYYILEMNDLVDEMIEAVDDGDGEIDYDEFVSMIQKY